MRKEAMKKDDSVVAGGAIWHIAYHSLKQSNIPPDILCPCWSNNGWMKQSSLDPTVNIQVVQIVQSNFVPRPPTIMNSY